MAEKQFCIRTGNQTMVLFFWYMFNFFFVWRSIQWTGMTCPPPPLLTWVSEPPNHILQLNKKGPLQDNIEQIWPLSIWDNSFFSESFIYECEIVFTVFQFSVCSKLYLRGASPVLNRTVQVWACWGLCCVTFLFDSAPHKCSESSKTWNNCF